MMHENCACVTLHELCHYAALMCRALGGNTHVGSLLNHLTYSGFNTGFFVTLACVELFKWIIKHS
jgi:hypothetical protein